MFELTAAPKKFNITNYVFHPEFKFSLVIGTNETVIKTFWRDVTYVLFILII